MRKRALEVSGVDARQDVVRDEGEIRFDPARLVAALEFHVREEKLAGAVTPASVRETSRRLRRESWDVRIPRAEWADLTNTQRLQWLLKVTGTAVTLTPDGSASLDVQGARSA